MRIDLHIHTHFSKDSNMKAKDIINAALNNGLNAIAITDHNEICGAFEVKKMAPKNLLVIPGEEVDTGEGEIIALGINKKIEKGMGLMRTCEIARKMNAFIIAPHPFDSLRKGAGKRLEMVMGYIDAIEVFNARTLFNAFNKRAYKFASKNGIPMVASSDSHFAFEIGHAYTIVNANANEEDIFNAIRHGGKIYGRGSGIKPHLYTFIQRFMD